MWFLFFMYTGGSCFIKKVNHVQTQSCQAYRTEKMLFDVFRFLFRSEAIEEMEEEQKSDT